MTRTFGDQGHAPGMYWLGGDVIKSLIFKLDWEHFNEDCNLREALDRLHGASLRNLDFMQVRNSEWDIYIVEEREIKVKGKSHDLRILRELLELTRKGVKPFEATWFCYYNDGERNLFFVLHAGKIVDDCYSFLNVFPLVLGGMGWDASDFGLCGHPGFDDAFERYWYRKFYTETLAGQLMVLSPNELKLYHYDREVSVRTQYVMSRLLVSMSWVVIPLLTAIAFPILRFYMALAALAFVVPWVSICWRLLKTGRI